MFCHCSERKDKTKIYEMNYQANKPVHKPCNCNNSVYICISTVKKLTLCNNGGHLYLQQQGEGCQSVTDFGLHRASFLRRAIALARHRAPNCCVRRVIFSAPRS